MDVSDNRAQDEFGEVCTGERWSKSGAAPVDGFVSTREAAVALGMSERTVRRAIRDGKLAATKDGWSYRIDRAALEQFAPLLRPPAAPRPLARVVTFPGQDLAPLPTPLSSFVGRDAEVAAVVAALKEPTIRLLTLTGAGGIGKTRLALVAAGATDAFADGAVLVSLADVPRPELVMTAIAQALGLRERPWQQRTHQLMTFLGRKQILLVLDNFEHLLDAGSEVAAMLAGVPGVKALITSRAPLRVMGERELPVPPMTLAGSAATPAELLASEAGRLFAERAREHDPSFSVDAASAPLIAQICAELDGLPLAIELAAVRVKVLPPDRLHARLEQRLQVLTRSPRDAPTRHATMRGAIAWSYDLLSPPEQQFFQRLAVFPGGATLDAAAAVSGVSVDLGEEPARDIVVDRMTSLIEQSMIGVEPGLDGERRYRMLETIRQFGLERLAAAGEADAARAALAGYMLALAASLTATELVSTNKGALDRLEASRSELHASLVWMEDRDADAFVRLVAMLPGYWYGRGHYQEAQSWLERALARADKATALDVARLQVGLSRFQVLRGKYDAAAAGFDRGIRVLREQGSKAETAVALNWRAGSAMYLGDHTAADAIFFDACQVAEQVEDPRKRTLLLGILMANLGVCARARREFDLAESRFERAVEHFQAHDTMLDRGESSLKVGHFAFDELGHLAIDRGDYALARFHYHAYLEKVGADDDMQNIEAVLVGAARVATSWGQFASAARLFAMADTLQRRLGLGMILPSERDGRERDLAVVRAQLGDSDFAAAWSEGQGFSLATARGAIAALASPAASDVAFTTDEVPAADALTRRERDVLRQLAEHKTDREIADALYLSLRTVNWHVGSVLSKLGVATRRDAVVKARAEGLV
ncbi:MAG: LuxR C-terminal-related transcriptional regulator [Thermomicrobiales bacterium]